VRTGLCVSSSRSFLHGPRFTQIMHHLLSIIMYPPILPLRVFFRVFPVIARFTFIEESATRIAFYFRLLFSSSWKLLCLVRSSFPFFHSLYLRAHTSCSGYDITRTVNEFEVENKTRSYDIEETTKWRSDYYFP
jgi:hypothetical protein